MKTIKIAIQSALVPFALVLAAVSVQAGGPPAKEGESKRSYEMNTFDEVSAVQGPGMHLAVPGDMVRYTYIIDDEFIGNAKYKLQRAILGVHILDADYSEADGDVAKEWGAIHLDGAARKTVTGELTNLLELRSDYETENQFPPYVYNIPELITDDGKLVLEVFNLNSEGGDELSREYGDFNMLRGGLHLYYVERD